MAYSNYFKKLQATGSAATGFSSKYFQSGRQFDTPDFATLMQEREQAQTLQSLATRPQEIDERAFGVAREQTLPNPFDSWQPPETNLSYAYAPDTGRVRQRREAQTEAFKAKQLGPVQMVTQDRRLIDGALARIRGQNARYDTALSNLTAQVNRAAQNTAWGIVDPGAETAVANAQKVFDKIDADWYASRREALEMLGEQPAAQIRKLAEAEQGYKAGTAPEVYLALREQLENAYGAELLDSLLEYVRMEENAKRMENARAEAYQRGQKSGWFSLRNVGTVPQKLVGGVVGTAEALGQGLVNAVTGNNRPLDLNTPAQEATARADEFRSGAQEDMSGVGRFLYGTGMSLADSGVAILTGQPWILGTAAANSTMQEVKRNGGSESQALTMGVIAGVTEMLTEKLSIDSLFQLSDAKTVKDMLWNAVKQALPEAAEETVSSVVNLLADDVVMGEKSRYNQLIASGMTDKQAFLELAKEVGLNALGGGLSGFVTGGTKSAVDLAANPNTQTEMAEQTEAQKAAEPAQAEETEIQGIMKKILEMPRINNTVANMIIQDPEAAAEFEKQTGVQLTGTTEQKRQTIKDTVRDMRRQPVEAVEAPAQTETPQTAQPEEPAVENSYRSYVVGMFANGVTTADAQEILSNPDLKAEWEAVTGKTLPDNYKSAVKMILQTKRDPQKLMQQEQPQYTVRPKPEPNTKKQYAPGDLIEDRVTGRTWEVTEALPAGKYVVEALNGKGELMQQTVGRNELRYQFNPLERDDGGGAWYERWGEMFGEDDTSDAEEPAEAPAEVSAAEAETQETAPKREPWQPIPKKDFKATPAIDKLGIKVDGSVASYRDTAQMVETGQARKRARQELEQRKKQLNPTQKEMKYARDIADGDFTADEIPKGVVNKATVEELAELIAATKSGEEYADAAYRRRAEINAANHELMQQTFGEAVRQPNTKLKGAMAPFTKLVMNQRQTERVMRQMFGDENGQKIYDTIFRPIGRNRAERIRFTNEQRDRIRTFVDETGKEREPTPRERELIQRLIDGEAVLDDLNVLNESDRQKVMDAAKAVNDGMDFEKAAEKYKIAKKEKLLGLTQAYADYMDLVSVTQEMDQTFLENGVAAYREVYADLYDAINDFLVAHGYSPIGFIKRYSPHFQKKEVQDGFFATLKQFVTGQMDVEELPTEIAGRTADFRPNKQWNPHLLTRQGETTDYDAEYGFAQYLDYVSNMFYHTDDIMRIRAAEEWFRGEFSKEGVRAALKEARQAEAHGTESMRTFLESQGALDPTSILSGEDVRRNFEQYVAELNERGTPTGLTGYSELVTWLQNMGNLLAGKQSLGDRSDEFNLGRKGLNWANKLLKFFARSNVAGNIASVLNQSSQLPQVIAENGRYTRYALEDMLSGRLKKEGFAEESDYLTEKAGKEKLNAELEQENQLVSKLFAPAGIADEALSTLAVRSRYLRGLSEGMSMEEAMREADDYGRRLMGSSGTGDMPQGFENKNPFSKILHSFQLEPANSLDRLISDLPYDVREIYRTRGKAAGNKYLAARLTKTALTTFALNQIAQIVYGGTPAAFDAMGWVLDAFGAGMGTTGLGALKDLIEKIVGEEDEEEEPFDWGAALGDFGGNVTNDIPFLQNFAALMGWGDQTLPVVQLGNVTRGVKEAAKAVKNQIAQGEEETGMSWADVGELAADKLVEAAAQVMPGGLQARKTYQGIKTSAKGERTTGYGDNEKLMFPTSDNFWKIAQAVLFGPNVSTEAREYYDSGETPLSAKKTAALHELEETYGFDLDMVYDLARQFEGAETEEKRKIINELPLNDDQKIILYTKLAGSSTQTGGWYRKMLDSGLTWDQITQIGDLYDAERDNKEKTPTERARALEAWMDEEELTVDQRKAVRKLYEGSPAEGDDRFDYLVQRLEDGVADEVVLMYLSDNQQEKYQEFAKPAKVPADVYVQALGYKSAEGKKQKDVQNYIAGLKLNKRQKRALWLALGYSEKTSPW